MRAFHAEAQNRGEPRRAAGAAREHAESLRIARDFVKQQGRRQIFPHVNFADCTQFEIPVRAADVFHFAEITGRAQPVAQVEGISLGCIHDTVFRRRAASFTASMISG
ncbi:hypothetical protein D3C83_25280 [compost metagenome]